MTEKEKIKRENYFALKRDETMALNEYLLSPISEIDLKKMNEGGMIDINDMTRPVGYEKGGNVITRRLASTRAQKPFENFLRDIGFTKKDEKTGKIRGAKGDWAKYLTSKNIKVGTVEATDELNRLLKAAGKPLYVDIASAGKNFSEEIISAVTGTQPGESGAREARNAANSKIVEIKKIATQAEGANSTKAKQKLLTSLFEKSFPVLKTVPKYAALLSTAVASKAFGYIPIATELGSDDEMFERLEEEQKKQQMMGKYNVTQEQMNQIANQPMDLLAPINKRGGGMMNMNEMIRPLGYEEGGDVGSFAEQRSLLDRISNFFKYQRRDPERFFGGSDGMEFHLDDPSIIQFIKRRAGTDDENSPEYQNELMKFMEEVTPKKNMGGIISLAGSK
jgi:hypothetical protein